jgi:hypothetical protein
LNPVWIWSVSFWSFLDNNRNIRNIRWLPKIYFIENIDVGKINVAS